MKFIEKLEAKHPRWGIQNLMISICVLNAVVYVLYLMRPEFISYLYLDRALVLSGQIWRLVTFMLIPPSFSIFWVFITIMCYYFIGTSLENRWGSFRFTAFYALGMLGTIIAAFITGGFYSGYYINLSMFLVFAYYYPNYEFLIFMLIPVKVKYLAYLDVLFLLVNIVLSIIASDWPELFAIIASLCGLIVFCAGDMINDVKAFIRRKKYMKKMK